LIVYGDEGKHKSKLVKCSAVAKNKKALQKLSTRLNVL
jgi:hypothetical protein